MTLTLAVTAPMASAKNEKNNGIGNGKPMTQKHQLDEVRAATAAFHSHVAAQRAGYTVEVADVEKITCIEGPEGRGNMGVHWVNGDLLGDGKIDATKPEALIYEPGRQGTKTLIAVEYIVDAEAWDAMHEEAPELFGQSFEFVDADNRYDLEPFYELHVWLWKDNPNGLFDDWNPRVSCDFAP